MPLIDLKSNLKNLKFGNDQPGYGSSGLPYIQTKMPEVIDPTGTFNPIFRPSSTGNLDYPIRGGNIDFQIGQQTYTLSSKIDQTRIKAFFEDKSRGTAFIQKQVGLQLTNPKMETGNTLFSIGQGLPFSGLLENTRVYNKGVNTLAQVGVSGTGAHALRHGLVPFAPLQKHYYAIVNAQNIDNEKSTNRLLNLNALKMTTSNSPFVNPQDIFDINTVNTLGISLNRNILFQYLGGPGSAYGIGATTIPRVVDTPRLRSSAVMTYDKLKLQTVNNITNGKATTNIQDFREQLPALKGTFRPWGKQTIDDRFYAAAGEYVDNLNASYPFFFKNDINPWDIPGEDTDDMIKFVFEAISNDDPTYSMAIFFRAFLTAGITDNHSAQLNPFRYMGRGENFYTYQGFDRSIGFSFRMAAGSKEELVPMYNRLNALIGQVYPDYGYDTNIMRAPLVKVTIGNYINRVPGFLESVNVTVDNGSPWEINLSGDSKQLPQVVDVSVSFKPIMNELPNRQSDKINNLVSSTVVETDQEISDYAFTENPEITESSRDVARNIRRAARAQRQEKRQAKRAENRRNRDTQGALQDQYYNSIKYKDENF